MISILILTKDEEKNLPACLESVNWSDDILVLDSFSSDRTVEVALQHGVRVLQNRFVNFADQRNTGLLKGNFKYQWILHLDADERVTPELRDEMLAAIASNDKEAYQLPSRMMLHERWLKYSGMFPWYQVRLGKKESLTFVQTGHGQRERLPAEKIGTLHAALVHYSFSKGFEDWIEKHNSYSTAEALHIFSGDHKNELDWSGILSTDATRRRRALKKIFSRLPGRPFLRFFYMYIVKRGFLDGRAGLTYCCLLCIYEYFIVLKERELRRENSVASQ